MDSGHWRNTGNAMFLASEMHTEDTPVQEFIPSCRTTIYGFPMRLYINKVPNNEALDDGTPDDTKGIKSSLGIYNFNLDKGCTDSLGLYEQDDLINKLDEVSAREFKDKYPYFETLSYEISANSDYSAGAFAKNDYKSIVEDFECRFLDENDIQDTRYYGTYKISDGNITLNSTNKWKFNDDGSLKITKFIANNLITGTYNISGDLTDSNTTISSAMWNMNFVETGEEFYDEIDDKTAGIPATATYVIPNYLDCDDDRNVFESELKIRFYETSENEGYFLFHETTGQVYMNARSHLKRLISWVMDADDTTFYDDFEKHFNLSSVIDYFIFVFTIGMVDNLGKNMMIDTYGPAAKGRTFSIGKNKDNVITYTDEEVAKYDNYCWYLHFYDMDSCLSLDNSGNVRFDTDIEMTPGVYNTSKSVLWTKFQRVFYNEIKARYEELRKTEVFTVDNFMKYYYDKQIAIIPEMDYNQDFYNKYLETEERRQYLSMMHGSQYESIYKWIEERLYFVDTYFEYGTDYSASCTVRVEATKIDITTEPIVYNISTYIPAYVKVAFRNNYFVRKKVGRGQTVEFSGFINTTTDQETIIYDAPNLKTIGDISKYTPKRIIIDQAIKLTSLIVGTDENPNPNLSSLSVGVNTYLTEIIAEQCSAMSYALDVSGCTNLEKISTKGSSISSVVLPSGAPLKSLSLSKSTAQIILNSLSILEDFDIEDTKNLTTLRITNCPTLTGYKDSNGNIITGKLWESLLSKYTPTNMQTTISFEAYGYVPNYNFLDAVAELANLYPDNFDISGEVTYRGSTIPQLYSYYRKDFPNLTVHYPDVNNVSSMFESYKNINAVWSRDEEVGSDLNITVQKFYYWTDTRDGEFPDDAYRTYQGKKGRLLDYYDDKDMKVLADEIKELLAPFSRFTNVNSMFRNMNVLEYLHDDTFDNIDLTNASTTYMFDGCNTLKYFEIPKTLTSLGSYMFGNCYKLIAYIPSSIISIEESSFYTNNHDIGMHPILLFESNVNRDRDPGIRDARYNIKRDADNLRALQTAEVVYSDPGENNKQVNLLIKYFADRETDLKYIKEITSLNGDPVSITDFNMIKGDEYANPLGIIEILPGSLKNVKNIQNIAIPPFNAHEIVSDESDPLKEFELSIARIFSDDALVAASRANINFNEVYIISPTDNINRVNRYFLMNTNPTSVYISSNFISIETSAFESCSASTIFITGAKTNPTGMKLKKIEDNAFKNSGLTEIFIPDTVESIGESAFAECQSFTKLKYSLGMTYIPARCFQNALKGDSGTTMESIEGFSSNITEIGNYAFDGAASLGIFLPTSGENKETDYDCYFNSFGDTGGNNEHKNLDYFTNLQSIGNFAFRNVHGITRINIKPTVSQIGASAFYPPESGGANETLLVWDTNGDYSNLEIESSAFINRQFCWLCDTPGFADKEISDRIIKKVVYIPRVKRISAEAFSPYSTTEGGAKLDFVLTQREPLADNDGWTANFVTNCLDIIYNFNDVIEYNSGFDGNEITNALYFLTKDTSEDETVYKALLARMLKDDTTAYIPANINYRNQDYILTEILDEAFIEHDKNLNNIWFEKTSEIRRLGNNFFKTTGLINILVVDEHGTPITEDGKILFVPKSLVTSIEYPEPIGEGNPFKNTSWFKQGSAGITDDYVYLNEYCIGYISADKTKPTLATGGKVVKEGTKYIYESAFSGESTLKTFAFPSTLTKIYKNAFSNCAAFSILDFSPCKDSLTYIGNEAFMGDSSLEELNYTKAVNYVGMNAFSNCTGLTTITFEEGTSMDSTSEPINPYADTNGFNTIIKKFVIPKSMGEFFKQGGPGFNMFSKLSNLKDLVIGGIAYEKKDLPTFESMNLSEDELAEYYGNGAYALDLATITMDDGTTLGEYYDFAKYNTKPLKLKTNTPYFYAPVTCYESDLNISNVTTEYEASDILRILLGFKKRTDGTINTLTAQRSFVNIATAAVFMSTVNGRISFKIAEKA